MLDGKHESSCGALNKLPPAKRARVLKLLCDGMSMEDVVALIDERAERNAPKLADRLVG